MDQVATGTCICCPVTAVIGFGEEFRVLMLWLHEYAVTGSPANWTEIEIDCHCENGMS